MTKIQEKSKKVISNPDFEELWSELNHNQRRFVVQMGDSRTKKDAAESLGLVIGTVYQWGDEVDKAVELYQDNIAEAARGILADNVAKAALIKIAGLDSDDEKIRQLSSSEILDRHFGKAMQPTDITTDGEPIIIQNELTDEERSKRIAEILNAARERGD